MYIYMNKVYVYILGNVFNMHLDLLNKKNLISEIDNSELTIRNI